MADTGIVIGRFRLLADYRCIPITNNWLLFGELRLHAVLTTTTQMTLTKYLLTLLHHKTTDC